MTRNYAEREREFIDELRQRTGRDLAQWMTAIDAAHRADGKLADKNAIIDWLRPQGLTFAHASWLERIHNNAGRPIYIDATPAHHKPAGAAASPTASIARAAPPPPHEAPPRPVVAAPPPAAAQSRSDAQALQQLMAKAKGLRPLAEHMAGRIVRLLPGVIMTVTDDLVMFERPRPLAVLWIGARELRLGLDLGDTPPAPPFARAKFPDAPTNFGHMLVLTDARQVGDALLEQIRQSDVRTNPPPP